MRIERIEGLGGLADRWGSRIDGLGWVEVVSMLGRPESDNMNLADAQLPWYFGTDSKTWQGDAGLRSATGAQLQRAAEAAKSRAPLEGSTMSVSAVEDQMLARCSAVGLARQIEIRLACLTKVQVEALRLHFTSSLPFGIDAAACLLASARRLVVQADILRSYAVARRELGTIRACGARRDLEGLHEALGGFLRARGQARALRKRRGAVDVEVLRRALHEAQAEQREAIAEQADKLVNAAKVAYARVEIVQAGRVVDIDDPRPWKRGA